jgi:hypothetical protein
MPRLPGKKQIDSIGCRQNDSASKKAAVAPDRSKTSATDAMTSAPHDTPTRDLRRAKPRRLFGGAGLFLLQFAALTVGLKGSINVAR